MTNDGFVDFALGFFLGTIIVIVIYLFANFVTNKYKIADCFETGGVPISVSGYTHCSKEDS